MITELISAVTDLPVIIQGALGSALFALVLFLGQKLIALIVLKVAHSSKQRRKQALLDEFAIASAASANDMASETYYGVVVLFRTARYLVRGLLWLTLGLISSATISVFGVIGYVGCLFYLLQALRLVAGADAANAKVRVVEIKAELDSLNEAVPSKR